MSLHLVDHNKKRKIIIIIIIVVVIALLFGIVIGASAAPVSAV